MFDRTLINDHFVIKKGRREDLAALQELYVETIRNVCSADYDTRQINMWASGVENKKRWNDVLTEQLVLVAWKDDKIVGFITLANGNYVDLLFVHKDHQRQGIAQILLASIEAEAGKLQQTVLSADVSKTAKPFFINNGFKVLEEQTVNIKGTDLTNYKMSKSLKI
ncbi:GNAT family N-acetyltransferase [Niabella sp.]|uniref:GNAT family N-acetyltransferase n=1 Tax=Niabella sp. TaxID=1962976 RepID=UPI002631AC0A|nr:GNAT family N-acetyltransferase [Niabella sp.]